jgi:hypothetical protein
MSRLIDAIDILINRWGRRVLQLGIVGAVWGVAYFDLKEPGYLKFDDPVPWSAIDRLMGNWGECPKGDALIVPGILSIVQFLQMPSTLEDWRRRLGQPTCHNTEGNKEIYVWKLQPLFNQQLFLRIEFSNNIATGYQFLKQQ